MFAAPLHEHHRTLDPPFTQAQLSDLGGFVGEPVQICVQHDLTGVERVFMHQTKGRAGHRLLLRHAELA